MPITEDHVPNVFVSVVIVQGSEQAPDGLATFKMGVVKLPVSVEAKELNITLTPDKDMDGGRALWPAPDGDLRRAGHRPRGRAGRGRAVAAPGRPGRAGPGRRARARRCWSSFWRDRGLGRQDQPAAGRGHGAIQPRARARGQGRRRWRRRSGLLRTRFADTAFWDPVVRTDQDGRAQVTVQLPDNLTTWRMQARGITADTQVGRAEVDVVSTPRPAGAPGAAPLLCRGRPGRDRHHRPQQHRRSAGRPGQHQRRGAGPRGRQQPDRATSRPGTRPRSPGR